LRKQDEAYVSLAYGFSAASHMDRHWNFDGEVKVSDAQLDSERQGRKGFTEREM
jgi:hypothetical protein